MLGGSARRAAPVAARSTEPKIEPENDPLPTPGVVWLMTSPNVTTPDMVVALPVPLSTKVPRLAPLPLPDVHG